MISKNQIKLITSLHHKKFRKEHGLFIAEGEKVVEDLLFSEWKVQSVLLTKDFYENKFSEWKVSKSIPVEIISEKELEKISALTKPQQIIAVAKMPENKLDANLLKDELSLMLDGINDPGNLGTIIRIADWFGISTIICSENCADVFNPKTVQSTMGSLFRVNVFYESLPELLKNISADKIPVYGTLLGEENIYLANLSAKGIIVIGSESHGISNEVIPFIINKITIPSFSVAQNKKADSLNAAMAASIVCSEFRRR